MNRAFILPAAIAFSAHALLLFGFGKSPHRPPALIKTGPDFIPCNLAPYEEPPPAEQSDLPPGGKSQVALPSGEDVPVTTVPRDAMIMPVSIRPAQIDSAVTAIPTEVFRPGGPGSTPGGSIAIVALATLDNLPRAKFQQAPRYPRALQHSGETGEVNVEFVVDESGHVIDPRVVRSTNPEFEEATLRAVEKWTFEPGMHHGRVVRFRMNVPVKFAITD